MDTPTDGHQPEALPGGQLRVQSCEAAQLPAGFTPPLARVAQYPDCQQLQLWLPEAAKPEDWQHLRLRDAGGRMLLDEPVQALLQARTRLLLDALPWPAGELWLEIGHASGGCVRVQLHKDAAQRSTLRQPAAQADAGEDLRMRDAQRQQLLRRFSRRLSYTNQGRAGLVHYHEGDTLTLSLRWEMSGDDAEPLWIDVPTVQDWERDTGVPLARREEILRFVAETACREQSSSWTAELRDSAIVLLAAR